MVLIHLLPILSEKLNKTDGEKYIIPETHYEWQNVIYGLHVVPDGRTSSSGIIWKGL